MARTFISVRAPLDNTRGKQPLRREEEVVYPERNVRMRGQKQAHVPVMTKEVLSALAPDKRDVVIDATYGAGGHTAALKKSGAKVISVDADPATGADITGNFGDLEKILKKSGVKKIDTIVFDLGWRREQLAAGRGFSFLRDEPLLMSYGPQPRSGFFAKDIVNGWSERGIADALFGYGQERYAKRIAGAIVSRRARKLFETTRELAETVADAVPPRYRRARIHPATKTFQALRIAVNEELKVLEQGLRAAWKMLACGGRIAVITFHSAEDRIVKNLFREFCGHPMSTNGVLLYKKPLAPSAAEIKANPSARSAKLRAIEKVCMR